MSIESAVLRQRWIAIETSLVIISKIGGAISLISSFLLGRYILKSKPTWREISLTDVMLFCISVENVMTSFFGYFMGSWMVGSDTRGYLSYGFKESWTRPLAAGNTATCTAQVGWDIHSCCVLFKLLMSLPRNSLTSYTCLHRVSSCFLVSSICRQPTLF